MFGRQKMYKAGVMDTMQSNAEFMQKQHAAIEHMRHEVSQGVQLGIAMKNALNKLNGCYAGLSQYLNEKEKAALYKLHSSIDIKDLEKSEKYLLVALLYQLASNERDFLTENQKVYLRNIQKYLGISNPQIQADIDVISDIDSLDVQKAFLECILEFFYLQDGNEISDSQEECLGYFSVNKKHASVIEERVAHIYEILGPEGLADKYGFVPNATTVDDIQDHDPQNSPEDGEAINESKGTVEENDPSDSTCAKKPQESISGSQEGASSQPAGVTKNKRVGKNYGVRPGDAIRFWWSDTTFAIEKQINDRRRDRVQRSVAESKDIQEKLSSINNNTATIEETEKKP